ncbi:ATP-grasp domain-containing protein [Phytomonospora endophytica]|uniref:Biotin carboxylase n=1 Tax=Phytomonospora endophytica TaxID=714109 RepID=A0A841F9U4_9ACTN|nr:ATP-grasp domain-containing protein [Phytomonospora endophytica]MBB6033991.1 biotin carboxylase [Phytomonospora endophytica]GIG64488.1 hypothetical protein Pen01_07830 [Phytomonospora endophytica]
MSSPRHVVIVDVYAPNRRLAPEFAKAGYEVVRVQSTPEPPRVYRTGFDLSPYAANIVHSGDVAATVDALRAYAPEAVVAGGEMGVELADTLSEAMGLLTNGTALSPARRDKYVQMETVRAAGLRATRQLLITDAEELAEWHRGLGGRIVVKPVRSAAGDGVTFCDTPGESVAAYRRILGAENVFSTRNEGAIAQEYLIGGEYVVDTVGLDGQHHVTDLWKYEKLSANGIPDLSCGIRLLPRRGPVQEQIVPYALDVLDALGIRHGAAHMELKLTPDGPCLVEVGARTAGFDTPFYATECIGEAQMEWVVDAYVRPERFAARWKDDYELKRHFISALAVSTVDAELRSYPLLDRVEALESLYDVRPLVKPGDRLTPTVDDLSTPFIANFCHPVEEIVDRDFGTFRHLDGAGFYDVAES